MVDRYTKTVLTIIAAALVGLLTQNAIKPSQAQSDQVQKVAICQEGQPNSCASLGRGQGAGAALGLRVVPSEPAHDPLTADLPSNSGNPSDRGP